MVIRPMEPGDYDRVYALWLGTPGMGLNALDDGRDGVERYLRRNPNTCFVAEEGGEIIGVLLSGHDGRRGYVSHMAVRSDRQRHGVGKLLLDAAMAALEREGISKVALVVFARNEKGNAFWEKQGFTVREDLVYRNKNILPFERIDT